MRESALALVALRSEIAVALMSITFIFEWTVFT